HFFEAAREEQVIVLVEVAFVSGAKPTLGVEGVLVGGRVFHVAGGDVRAADDDLAALEGTQRATFGVDHGDIWSGGLSYRSWLARPWRQGVASHLMGRFGHAVGFDHGGLEDSLEFLHDRGWQGGGTGADETQVRQMRAVTR